MRKAVTNSNMLFPNNETYGSVQQDNPYLYEGKDTTVSVVQNPMNTFVYGKKYRAILAAEGMAVTDSEQAEFVIRKDYLPTILKVGIFNSYHEAVYFLMSAAVAYGVIMMGQEFQKYFNWPGFFKVNAVHYFNDKMVNKIASMKIEIADVSGLPQLPGYTQEY